MTSHDNALPDRCYRNASASLIAWTERHLDRVRRLRLFDADALLRDRYIRRMLECRQARRCNLQACPQCSVARGAEMSAALLYELARHPHARVVSVDALLPPRDRLVNPSTSPYDDVQLIRRNLKAALPFAKRDGSYVFVLGRYEVSIKRKSESSYARRLGSSLSKTRAVVPHAHFVVIAKDGGRSLTREEVRARLKPFFAASRQLHTRYLDRRQSLQDAVANRMGYVFKGRTSELTGVALQDFVLSQMSRRQDAWILNLRHEFPLVTTSRSRPRGMAQPAELVFGRAAIEPAAIAPVKATRTSRRKKRNLARNHQRKRTLKVTPKKEPAPASVGWEDVFSAPPILLPDMFDMRDDGLYVLLAESLRVAGAATLTVERDELRISFVIDGTRHALSFSAVTLQTQHRYVAHSLRHKGFFLSEGHEELVALAFAEILHMNSGR